MVLKYTNMTEEFTLTTEYQGKNQDFIGKLILQGHSHKFEVNINGITVYFEPDESGNYRVIRMPWQEEKELQKVDKVLLGAITQKIEDILA